jgi:transposase
MLADQLDYVVGVDTHRDRHAFAVVAFATGALCVEAELDACEEGYQEALALAAARAPGRRAWAVEGSGSYGKGLVRFLLARGEQVFEVERPRRDRRPRGGKSDRLDALRATRTLTSHKRLAQPRAQGHQEALRVLVGVHEGASETRRRALNQLRALLVTAPEPLRIQLRGLTTPRLLTRCLAFEPDSQDEIELAATQQALKLLATRIEAATREKHALKQQLQTLTKQSAPRLLNERGIGPIGATRALLVWSHKGRVHSDGGYARLAGAAPIPASSGKTIRYRLDCGGDRRLNSTLHQIVISRRRTDPATQAYFDRRRAEGKTDAEITRSLKRYIARRIYRILETTTTA